MNKEEAVKFVDGLAAEDARENTERPASARMAPMNLGTKIVARTLNDEARIKNISGRMVSILKERVQDSNEFDELNDRLRHATGHGSAELEQKSLEVKRKVRSEMIEAVYQTLDWCTKEAHCVDEVLEGKLKTAFNQGVEQGRKDAERAYNEELSKLRDQSPLVRSLSEKLK